jgi:hypothetical protein
MSNAINLSCVIMRLSKNEVAFKIIIRLVIYHY